MRKFKAFLACFVVIALLGVVHPQTPFPVSWTFSGDTITMNLNSGADTCSGTFTNGQMRGAQSTGGTFACGAKMVSPTEFSLIVIDLTFSQGGVATGQVIGATGVQTYGQSGSATPSATNFVSPNAVGQSFALANYQATTFTFSQVFGALPNAEAATSTTMIVRIHNQVEKHWSSSLTSTGMTTWTLSGDLDQGYTRDLTIVFDPNASSATATATFTSGSLQFVITASLTSGTKDITLNWGSIHMENDHYLIPPNFDASNAQSLGWLPGGTYNIGVFRPATLTNQAQGLKVMADWKKTWMKDYAAFINDKAMHNIVIPGTHDAGSTRFQYLIIDYYFRTQTEATGILAQLNAGVRSFDLRIYEDSSEFYIMHNTQVVHIGGSTKLTLTAVLDDVNTFVTTSGNENEIIILDFHLFGIATGQTFNYVNCQGKVTSHALNTNSRLILPTKAALTYSALISDSNTARVIAAWNNAGTVTSPFWSGVSQTWAGASVYLTTDMYTYFNNQFTAAQTQLTSAQDALNRPDGGPFFYWHGSSTHFSDMTRVPYLNIIHSDFIEKSIIVETSVALNLFKVDAVAEVQSSSGAASLVTSLLTAAVLSFLLFF